MSSPKPPSTAKCARCPSTEKLTRSHVPSRFVCKRVWGSLNKAFKAGKYQVHWLCEPCRRKHQALEEQLLQKKWLELAEELRELHRSFCTQDKNKTHESVASNAGQ